MPPGPAPLGMLNTLCPVVNVRSDFLPFANCWTARLMPKQWPPDARRARFRTPQSIAAIGSRIPVWILQLPAPRAARVDRDEQVVRSERVGQFVDPQRAEAEVVELERVRVAEVVRPIIAFDVVKRASPLGGTTVSGPDVASPRNLERHRGAVDRFEVGARPRSSLPTDQRAPGRSRCP